MTRELAEAHDPVVLSCLLGAALAVHRAAPAFSLIELLSAAARPGAVHRALAHARGCDACLIGGLCPVGARLAQAIGRRRSRRRRAA
jgi:hypothetical protein